MDTKQAQPTICIVDDDESVRRALARLVESFGMQAESFESPEVLLSSGSLEGVDCFLLDVHMPGMDGFELHERVTAAGLLRPVIFLTAHPDAGKRSRARACGAIAYLEKPFDEAALLGAIRRALHPTGDATNGPGLRPTDL